jgi:hypothetical protein
MKTTKQKLINYTQRLELVHECTEMDVNDKKNLVTYLETQIDKLTKEINK